MGKTTLALVGSESLLGREIRDIVATSAPDLELRLIAADKERPGTLTRVGDEPAMVTELNARALHDARAVFLAGSAESSRKALRLLEGHSAPVIDLTGTAEEDPSARLRAPMIERDGEGDAGDNAGRGDGRGYGNWRKPDLAIGQFLAGNRSEAGQLRAASQAGRLSFAKQIGRAHV